MGFLRKVGSYAKSKAEKFSKYVDTKMESDLDRMQNKLQIAGEKMKPYASKAIVGAKKAAKYGFKGAVVAAKYGYKGAVIAGKNIQQMDRMNRMQSKRRRRSKTAPTAVYVYGYAPPSAPVRRKVTRRFRSSDGYDGYDSDYDHNYYDSSLITPRRKRKTIHNEYHDEWRNWF